MPIKTALTVITFVALVLLPEVAPALKDYQSLDPHKIGNVLDLPLPRDFRIPGTKAAPAPEIRETHTKKPEAKPTDNLVDPTHSLDHFYQALLKGGTVRILHYGDSPTTGDLITADARAMLQAEFGDAGSGFVLVARPWAWYNHRGVEMEASSNWKIDIAGIAQLKDGMHGLGGVSFLGSPGAVAHWKLKNGQHAVLEVAYLAEPDGGAFAVDADGQEIGVIETAAEVKSPQYQSFKIPPGASRFDVRVTRGTVRLYGA